jgi:hypothetical protein
MESKTKRPGGSRGASEGIESATIPLISQVDAAAQAVAAACWRGAS